MGLVLLGQSATLGDDPDTKLPSKRIAGLIKQLGADSYDRREEASKALDQIGEPALPELRKAATSADPEVRRRAEGLIQAISERGLVEVRRFIGPDKTDRHAFTSTRLGVHFPLSEGIARMLNLMVVSVLTRTLPAGAGSPKVSLAAREWLARV
jgi:hypothetical protein